MTQGSAWPKRLTTVIAGQVQRIRGERRMSAQQLADATAELGHPVARSVIANLESGRRDTVSIAELVVLARALRVPPLLLVFPIGSEPTVEVLPGVQVPTWPAALWFTGEGSFPGEGFIESNNSVIADFREHDEEVERWLKSKKRADDYRQAAAREPEPKKRDEYMKVAELEDDTREKFHERSLRLIRQGIREWGCEPGQLPAELAHIDEAPDGQR